jgi:hypothetical protein
MALLLITRQEDRIYRAPARPPVALVTTRHLTNNDFEFPTGSSLSETMVISPTDRLRLRPSAHRAGPSFHVARKPAIESGTPSAAKP